GLGGPEHQAATAIAAFALLAPQLHPAPVAQGSRFIVRVSMCSDLRSPVTVEQVEPPQIGALQIESGAQQVSQTRNAEPFCWLAVDIAEARRSTTFLGRLMSPLRVTLWTPPEGSGSLGASSNSLPQRDGEGADDVRHH